MTSRLGTGKFITFFTVLQLIINNAVGIQSNFQCKKKISVCFQVNPILQTVWLDNHADFENLHGKIIFG